MATLDNLPTVFGFINTGNTCYFNTLIQALFSCPSFVIYLSKLPKPAQNIVVKSYLDLYKNYSAQNNSMPLLQTMCGMLQYCPIIPGTQQDIHEGLVLLLESMHLPTTTSLFDITYDQFMYCKVCRKTTPTTGTTDIVVDLTEVNPLGNKLTSKEHIEKYINQNFQIPDLYKCETCNNTNETGQPPRIMRVAKLKQIGSIIILMFKKYTSRTIRYFPNELNILDKHYILVAQIEHYGNNTGGHYNLLCLRHKPDSFHKRRRQRTMDHIENLRDQLKSTYDTKIIEELKQCMKLLELDTLAQKNNTGVFLIDDSVVRFQQDGFTPTINTYMVIYHIV